MVSNCIGCNNFSWWSNRNLWGLIKMGKEHFRDERILFTQMSLAEALYIYTNHINNIRKAKLTFQDHSRDRLKQKDITDREIIRTVRKGVPIELHIVDNSPRVLFRLQRPNQTVDICVVVDILDGTIVTAFTNHTNDKHSTLHEEIYNPELDVIATMKGLIE